MRVLVLDDDQKRHDVFARFFIGQTVKHVYTSDQAIEALQEEPWDLIQLDHDLADKDYHELKAGLHGEKTGVDVAVYIARVLDRDKLPARVIVHSWNPPGAKMMCEILRDAGIFVVYNPFNPGMAD